MTVTNRSAEADAEADAERLVGLDELDGETRRAVTRLMLSRVCVPINGAGLFRACLEFSRSPSVLEIVGGRRLDPRELARWRRACLARAMAAFLHRP